MITQNDINQIFGADVYAADGDKIGSAGQVYLGEQSGNPEWVTVHTGLFGMSESFVPLQNATLTGDRLEVPFGKAQVKDAPRIDADGALSPAEEDELYTYYGLSSTDGRLAGDGYSEGDSTVDGGYTTASERSTDDAMTRSEEHLVAGTRSVETGKARLRKYVVTEQQQVSIPVSHEEVRLEREPITDANRAAAYDGPDITENEYEVTLHAERPVVDTETVAVEKVKLGKKTVRDTETVSGEVRKEQIEFDDETTNRRERV
jgi:uncharacterized protein (TIGR02271 family)